MKARADGVPTGSVCRRGVGVSTLPRDDGVFSSFVLVGIRNSRVYMDLLLLFNCFISDQRV